MKHRNSLTIHNDNILHNLAIIKKFAPNSCVLPMIKANAFGHGLLNVAKLLQDHVASLAVARYEEAIFLLKENIVSSIVVMSGWVDKQQLTTLVDLGCQIGIATKHQLYQLTKGSFHKKVTVWLKINTGMNRLGLSILDSDQAIVQLKKFTWVDNIILMTHLSDADLPDNKKTHAQIKTLKDIANYHGLSHSIANSASIVQYPESHGDFIRPGIMLYGSSPIASLRATQLGLKSTMTLSSYLMDIREQKKGDAIGYGSAWLCEKDILLGIIPFGYGDGYPRLVQPDASVLVNGIQCPIVGRVSMDLITIDISACKSPRIGDTVELWGEGILIDDVAYYANTLSNELFTHISPRTLPISMPNGSLLSHSTDDQPY